MHRTQAARLVRRPGTYLSWLSARVRPWPRPAVRIAREPRFFFVLTQPNSGSTAIVRLLATAPGTMLLAPNGEGQWLVPGMRRPGHSDPDTYVDWHSVRAVWLQRVADVSALVPSVDLVIDKSPDHLVRVEPLLAAFPEHAAVVLVREPFATCASLLKRYGDLVATRRTVAASRVASAWLRRARLMRDVVSRWRFQVITYEAFCARPSEAIDRLARLEPVLRGVDLTARLPVKDYQPAPLEDQNAAQIGSLDEPAIAAIAEAMASEGELLSFFGYHPDPPTPSTPKEPVA